MRTKPRLTPTLITCDNPGCERQRLGYYPKRESVRRKMSPLRYCSPECQRQHWEARKRAERAAAKVAYACAGPSCPNEIEPVHGPGRPPIYCSIACKRNAARSRRRREPGSAVVRARAAVREAEGPVHAAIAPYRQYKQHYDVAFEEVEANRQRVDDAAAKLEAFRKRQQERAQAAEDLIASAPAHFLGSDGRLVPNSSFEPQELKDLRRELAALQPQWGEGSKEFELEVALRRAKEKLAKSERGLQMVEGLLEQAEEALRDPLAVLEQARAAVTAAEERNERRAAQARARRARAGEAGVGRQSEVTAILDTLQIDVDQDAKDRARARTDPEYRDWLRERGMLKEGW